MRRRFFCKIGPAVALLAVPLDTSGRVAQDHALDSGIFQIQRGATVIGREEFAIRRGRRVGAAFGFTVSARAAYPPARPTLRITSLIEFGPDSQPATGQIELADGEAKRLLVAVEPRRVTVRTITPSEESARQYPATGRTLIVDEALVSSFAFLPRGGVGPIAVIEPQALRRQVVELVDRGLDQTAVGRRTETLRHFTLGSGDEARHLWYDEQGRLQKLVVPATEVTAFRTDPEKR